MSATLPSADDIVARYIELRDYVESENKRHAEEMEPYTAAMKTLEAAADAMLKATGQKALSTVHGTAFYNHTLSVTCEDPKTFLDFVFQRGARQFLTSHVAKDAVKEYMDGPGQGNPPPGVKTQGIVKVQFRKA
jgi:hypothetical protein